MADIGTLHPVVKALLMCLAAMAAVGAAVVVVFVLYFFFGAAGALAAPLILPLVAGTLTVAAARLLYR